MCKQMQTVHSHTFFWLTFYCRISNPSLRWILVCEKKCPSTAKLSQATHKMWPCPFWFFLSQSSVNFWGRAERNIRHALAHGGESYVPTWFSKIDRWKYMKIFWTEQTITTWLLSPNMQLKLPQTIEVSCCRLLDYERCIWTRKQWGSVMTSDASKWLLEPVLAPWKPWKTGPTLKKIYKSIWIYASTFGSKQMYNCSQKMGKSYSHTVDGSEIPNKNLGCILCTTL